MIIQPIVDIAEICCRKGIKHVVISPGSRSAHLTISFARHGGIKKWVIPDERSAAYVALGIAQQSGAPVALVCTSGTATINFYPAIAEAYYQNVPLLVLTADRPAEWIDKNDGQTIRQNNLYQNHIKKSLVFPESFDEPGAREKSVRMVDEAINLAVNFPQGPVHINVPISEPFYPLAHEEMVYSQDLAISKGEPREFAEREKLDAFFDKIKGKRVVIVPGQYAHQTETVQLLGELIAQKNIPVFSDIISNTFQAVHTLRFHDGFVRRGRLTKPEVLMTFGRSVISKKLKLFLRAIEPLEHVHISDNDYAADTFLSLKQTFSVSIPAFLEALLQSGFEGDSKFLEEYLNENDQAEKALKNFLESADFGEFKAVKTIIDALPKSSLLHLANSMPVRYANIINADKNIEVFSNRGTSGIDGCTSTAVGHSLTTDKLNVLLTGDMAFFYDRNALWHNYPLPNLRIIIFNNHGGGIFRLIEGPAAQPELEEYFETNQRLSAKNTASDFGMDYYLCKSDKELALALKDFFRPSETGKILEIETNKTINQKVFAQYKSILEHGT